MGHGKYFIISKSSSAPTAAQADYVDVELSRRPWLKSQRAAILAGDPDCLTRLPRAGGLAR
jgi:hypothetical protein